MVHRKGSIHCSCTNVLYPAQAIQWDKYNLTRFSNISHLQIFPECFCRSLKMLWPAGLQLDHT